MDILALISINPREAMGNRKLVPVQSNGTDEETESHQNKVKVHLMSWSSSQLNGKRMPGSRPNAGEGAVHKSRHSK